MKKKIVIFTLFIFCVITCAYSVVNSYAEPNCTSRSWNNGTVYISGDNISHNEHNWEAKWWTRGEEPGTTGDWGVWKDLGICSDTDNDNDGDDGDNDANIEFPDKIFAPYVDVLLYPTFSINDTYVQTNQKYYTLAFIVSGTDCEPAWGGVIPLADNFYLDEIENIRRKGGNVIVSFGGANGTELALCKNSVSELQAAYQSVIDAYKLTWVDFDIEGYAVSEKPSIDLRNKAIKGLQAANPDLKVAFCLPVLPQGLTQDGVYVLENAISNGVRIDTVNIMAMDYGDWPAPDPEGNMGKYAIDAAQNTYQQMKDMGLDSRVGITPMIGQNDVSSERFYVDDAEKVISWAKSTEYISMLSMWSSTRDNGDCPGQLSASCSGIVQDKFAFTNTFKSFISNTDPTPPGNIKPTVEITSPGNGDIFKTDENITITASANDSDGSVVQVEFFQGTVSLGVVTKTPYSVNWSNVPKGIYKLTAVVKDNEGGVTRSSSTSVTVTGDENNCGGLPVYPEGIGNYKAGDRVQNNDGIYEVKPWPFTGWANASGSAYEPGVGFAWEDAWIFIESCGSDDNGDGDDGNDDTEAPSIPENVVGNVAGPSTVALSWNASTDNVGVQGYKVYKNNTYNQTVTDMNVTLNNLIPGNVYRFAVSAIDAAGNESGFSQEIRITIPSDGTPLTARALVGYWETWDATIHTAGHIPLNDIDNQYNVLNIAFPILAGDGTCILEDGSVSGEDPPEPEEIAQAQAAGKKILISIGGAAASLNLNSTPVVDQFIKTCIEVIEFYGLNGIDIDIESGLVAGNGAYPALSTSQSNLIRICLEITNHFGPEFMLTMAPETAYVTGGTVAYGGPWGAYLPIIDACRDKISWIQMQYYNGSMYGKDGSSYAAGSVEGMVKQTEAMIDGFFVARGDTFFEGLPASKIVIGLPATPGAAGSGYMSPASVHKGLDDIIATYPNLRGLMTWSANWDASNNYEFANSHGPYLKRLGPIP